MVTGLQDYIERKCFPAGIDTDDVKGTEVCEGKEAFAGTCRIICLINVCPTGEFTIGLTFVFADELLSYVSWEISDIVL